jgi:hypothetical protein
VRSTALTARFDGARPERSRRAQRAGKWQSATFWTVRFARIKKRGHASFRFFFRFHPAILLGCALLLSSAATAQKADSTAADSAIVQTKSPKAAVMRSAVLPGWGQWYNEQKIKSFLVLGGELALAGNAAYQNRLALRSKTLDEREFYKNNRNQTIWWFAAVYFLSLADAYGDAQLWHFDAGPNLSGGIDPDVKARVVLCFALHE